MEIAEAVRCLSLFGIPGENTPDGVREILARLVAAGSLSLGELQTARDIVKRKNCTDGLAYLFLSAMFLSQRGGNTFLSAGKGVKLLQTGGYMDDAADGVPSNEVFFKTVRDIWSAAESAADELDGDVVVKRTTANGVRWFFQRNMAAVEAVEQGLAARAAQENDDEPLSDAELAAAVDGVGFILNAAQENAVRMVAQKRFVVVTGGPGTGKTTVVRAMLRALMARGLKQDEFELVAPTGRAAQRMGGKTIHSLLGGYPPNWKYTADNRLPLKLVVVDESSMVDIHLMKALIAALPPDCRLVLLGDKDQLPSVETGALLGDIVGDNKADFVVRLTESKRFGANFAKSASSVNQGDAKQFADSATELASDNGDWLPAFDSPDTENRCFRCLLPKDANPSICHARLLDWAKHYGLLDGGRLVRLTSDPGLKDDEALTDGKCSDKAKAIFGELDRSRILTVVRNGPYGVHGVNELLVKARFGGRLPFNPLAKAGVPVIITRNTPSKKLWNGDVGVTVEGKSGMVVLFPRGENVVCCPVGLLPEHELAYAITVHKSQGSEYGNVLVALPDDWIHPLLNRQLVYTGITRAKKRAVILGTMAALTQAIRNKLERDTGLTV